MLDPKMKASEMDIRSYFAAMAMQGIISSPRDLAKRKDETTDDCIMRLSSAYADALIAVLNKEVNP